MRYKVTTVLFFLMDFLFVYLAFLFFVKLRQGSHTIIQNYLVPLISFGLIWILISLLGGKYKIHRDYSYGQLIIQILKIDTYALTIIFFLIIFYQKFYYSRMYVFGTIILTMIIELVVYSFFYFSLRFHLENSHYARTSIITSMDNIEVAVAAEEKEVPPNLIELPYVPEFSVEESSDAVIVKLWQQYLTNEQQLFDFINESIDLTKFSKQGTFVLNSEIYYNIENIDPNSQQLFINLHKINDLRRLNMYFIKVNENLVDGGIFVLKAETITERARKMIATFGLILGKVVYFFDFIFNRAFPKIPILQGLYFGITHGSNRALPEPAILGRLYFCGFELLNQREIDGFVYYIFRKIKRPSQDKNPSYGLLIRLKRTGKDGKVFHIYKLRTMHPYSEYLQEYIYQRNKLGDSGKFNQDFRITSWGKFLRKFWIDEIPQVINLFKGDMKIVGVRPLSEHYLGLYPDDIKEFRMKFKPGILPPVAAEDGYPKNFEGTVDAERTYLMKKLKHPILTDIEYFFRILYMILLNKTRSQ
jgi:lipopolysaccharide/colanic/teichoic acid biosynthesis glycosyltransferase